MAAYDIQTHWEDGVMVLTWTGVADLEAIIKTMQMLEEAEEDHKSDGPLYRLHDMLGVTDCTLSFDTVMHISRARREALLNLGGMRAAFVVDRPDFFGIVRQYQSMLGDAAEIAIFADVATAREWLLSGERAPESGDRTHD